MGADPGEPILRCGGFGVEELPRKLRVAAATGCEIQITLRVDAARTVARLIDRGLAVEAERTAADTAWHEARQTYDLAGELLADAAGAARAARLWWIAAMVAGAGAGAMMIAVVSVLSGG